MDFYVPTLLQRARLSASFWFAYLVYFLLILPLMTFGFFIKRYRFPGLKEAKASYAELIRRGGPGKIICANHISWIDPFLLSRVFFSPLTLLFKPKLYPWGFASTRYTDKLAFSPVFLFLRVIPVAMSKEENKDNWKMKATAHLLRNGHSILIFPEGRRSRSGVVEQQNQTSGVGFLKKSVPESQLVCVYFRGEKSSSKCHFPATGDAIHFRSTDIDFSDTEIRELNAQQITQRVLGKLGEMEADYLKKNPV